MLSRFQMEAVCAITVPNGGCFGSSLGPYDESKGAAPSPSDFFLVQIGAQLAPFTAWWPTASSMYYRPAPRSMLVPISSF